MEGTRVTSLEAACLRLMNLHNISSSSCQKLFGFLQNLLICLIFLVSWERKEKV